jgi:hypothetical protein
MVPGDRIFFWLRRIFHWAEWSRSHGRTGRRWRNPGGRTRFDSYAWAPIATLLEALNRHRGKGQQKVTVEHVHVHAGGQAVVGMVETPGGGDRRKSEDQPHALAHAPGATMPSADPPREPVPVACDEERPLPDARRNITGRTEGE